jgi:predicted ATPase
MKIYEFRIQGFRSLFDITWRPGNLNILIGPNGSGKSNLLKALELLSESAKGKLNNYVIKSGGILSFLWDQKINEIIMDIGTFSPSYKNDGLFYFINIGLHEKTGNCYIMKESAKTAYMKSYEEGEYPSYTNLFEKKLNKLVIFDKNKNSCITKNIDTDLKLNQNESTLSQLNIENINNSLSEFHNSISKASIYSDFRTDFDSLLRQPIVTRYEKELNTDGQNLVAVLHTLYTEDRKFKESINDAMKAAFNDEFEMLEFPPASDQRTQMRVMWKNLKHGISTANLSDGTLRYLYLLTILANPNPPPLIAIEEPGIGLHPSMLPIIAEYAVEASENSQIVFTTHNTDFLSAFPKDFIPTVTVVENKDGKTTLKNLKKEDLKYWIREYTLGDLFRSGELEGME